MVIVDTEELYAVVHLLASDIYMMSLLRNSVPPFWRGIKLS